MNAAAIAASEHLRQWALTWYLVALADGERGLGERRLALDPEARHLIARAADGDARRALNMLEIAADLAIVTFEGERGDAAGGVETIFQTQAGDVAQLIVLSARSSSALDAARQRLAAHLRAHPSARLADVAHTLQIGRRGFKQRMSIVARNLKEATAKL